MNKKLLILIVALFLVFITVQGALAVGLTDGLVSYWDGSYSSSTAFDVHGSNDGTASNTRVFGTDGKIWKGFDFTKGDDDISIPHSNIVSLTQGSMSIWIKPNSASYNLEEVLWGSGWTNGYSWLFAALRNDGTGFTVRLERYSSSTLHYRLDSPKNINANEWNHIVYTTDGTTIKLYINGELQTLTAFQGSNNGKWFGDTVNLNNFYMGVMKYTTNYRYAKQLIDEFAIYDRALSSDEITELYNHGTGLTYPFVSNFSIIAKNIFNKVTITDFNTTINGTFYETNDSIIVTSLNLTDDNLYTFDVCAVDYFCQNYTDYNISVNGGLVSSLKQSLINLSVFNFFAVPVSNWIIKNGSTTLLNTSDSSGIVYLPAGEYDNVSIQSNNGSFSPQTLNSFNITALDNKTINFTITDFLVQVFAKNILTNATINNFSIVVNDLVNDLVNNYSTTTGVISFGGLNTLYNITIDADDYSLHDNSVILNVSSETNHTFYLYTDNSINLFIRNEGTGGLIAQQVNITLTGENVYTFQTSTGNQYIDNLIPGTYSIKLESSGFTTKFYSITVGSRSTQTLNTFMIDSVKVVSFVFKDSSSEQTLSEVLVSMSRWVNGSWQIVESKQTDIIGQASFNYIENTAYKFLAQKNEYSDKVFNFDLITEPTYIVKMDRTGLGVVVISDVSFSYSPNLFVDGNNSLSFSFHSPLGNLVNYSLQVVYPGGSQSFQGINAIGENFNHDFVIVNPSFFDVVTLNIEYFVSDGTQHTRTIKINIQSDQAKSNVFLGLKGKTYGLGVIERMILVIFIIVIIGGVTFMFAGAGASLVLSMLLFGLFAFMGFIPLWSIIITLFIGFVVVAKISSGGST